MDLQISIQLETPNIQGNIQQILAEQDFATTLIITNSSQLIMDYLNLPTTKDILTKRLEFWKANLDCSDFFDGKTLTNLTSIIGDIQTQKVLKSFFQSSSLKFGIIKKALIESDYQSLFEAAHYLKTSAGIVGAINLFDFCDIAATKGKSREQFTTCFFQKFTELESQLQLITNKATGPFLAKSI